MNHHDRGQGGHDIGPHSPASPMAVAFARQGQALARPQTGNSRRVDGVDLAVLTAQPYRVERQVGQAPVGGTVKHGVEGERAPLHRALHPMPAPAQMDHEGQDSASQAPFGLDEPTGHHDKQDDANAEGGARRQWLNQTMHRSRSQVYWVCARIWGYWVECFHNRLSIPNPSTACYSNW